MKFKFTCIILLLLIAVSAHAQRRRRLVVKDTITSNYQPSELFSPLFYSEKGNEAHAPNGEPGPKYWQNRVNYNLDASIDTVTKTLTATEKITYINNSPDALHYLWLQLDQNTYKKTARSNFVTGFAPGPNQHTDGYQIESVFINHGDVLQKVNFIISDTRMQIRLAKNLNPNGGVINLVIKYKYTIPGNFGGRTDYVDTRNGKIYEIAQW